ncbi:MAG: hypothetical protein ACI9CA_000514 [Natronomonas sp.]|jgi:hypothetical protein
MKTVVGPDGATLYRDEQPSRRGSKASYYVVYSDADRETRWGVLLRELPHTGQRRRPDGTGPV